jgi:hypothetical protein
MAHFCREKLKRYSSTPTFGDVLDAVNDLLHSFGHRKQDSSRIFHNLLTSRFAAHKKNPLS